MTNQLVLLAARFLSAQLRAKVGKTLTLLTNFKLLLVELVFNFLHRSFHAITITRVYQIDKPVDALMFRLGSSRGLLLTQVADHRNSLALFQSVLPHSCFTLVFDAIVAAKNTRYRLDETIGPVGYNFRVVDNLNLAVFHPASDFDMVQNTLISGGKLFANKLLTTA